MAAHFYKIPVKNIKKETADCVSIAFDIPSELQNLFQYNHGQSLTMRTYINNEEVRRSYSLCSSPLENEWRVAVKKVTGGLFSTHANNQLKSGDIIELMPPVGNFFTNLDAENKKNYTGIAAGSGITPVISIIKTILITEPKSSFTLIYGNRNRHSIIFKEELEALKNKYINRFSLIHILSREMTDADINHGRIDAEKCAQLFKHAANIDADEFFICGPQEMTFCVKDFLKENSVDENKIHFELFTAVYQKSEIKNLRSEIKDEAKSKISIKHDGIFSDFNLAFDDECILDAALHHGVELPYSCKAGVCCTCRAKLLEGEVEMETNYALEPWELAQGFILTCQSHPKTKKVVIDFDEK